MRKDIDVKLLKRYTKLTKHLVEICEVAKGIDSGLSTQEYIADFDMILQSVLFFQSKSNKAIYPKEKQFIDDLTEEGDILELAKHRLKEQGNEISDVNWQNIFECDSAVFEKIEGKIKELTKDYTRNLVAYVALAECLDGKSHFAKISDEIVDILYYFARLENGIDDNEVKHGILAYCQFAVDYYVDVVGNMEEFFADKQVKRELLISLRKEYKYSKRARRGEFIEKHIQSIKDRIAMRFKKDDE